MATVDRARHPRASAHASGGASTPKRDLVATPRGDAESGEAGPRDPNRTGVVFVHGIGTQPPCETFLDWSGPIVDLLFDWRRDHRDKDHDFAIDPVVRCDYDLTGQRQPFLELDVPAYDGHPAGSLVLTEAWWAARTRPPKLGWMTGYMRKALPRILDGIKDSYQERTQQHQADRWARLEARRFADNPAYEHREFVRSLVPLAGLDWIDRLDWTQKWLTRLAFRPILILGWLLLLCYAPFRAIPIQQLRDAAALKSVDNFMTRWFGEMPDIIDDPVQAANVRTCLVNAIRGLQGQGCERIVVVAHSGGAIVSFETLCDLAYADVRIDKLVTLGEGLALAWRIEDSRTGPPPGSRLLGNPRAIRRSLLWADFWSSYDPAPAGRLKAPSGVQLVDQTHKTINRMSIWEDHGSYWDNDEEFVIPLLRHLDTPAGDPSGSRFFRDAALSEARAAWRRSRVGILALWRWIPTLGAGVPIVVTTVTAVLGASSPGPARLGDAVANGWSAVPFHEIIAGPLDGMSGVARWPWILPVLGEWAIGSAIVAAAFLILAKVGIGWWWEPWDRRERIEARRREPRQPRMVSSLLAFGLLTVVCLVVSMVAFAYFWQ